MKEAKVIDIALSNAKNGNNRKQVSWNLEDKNFGIGGRVEKIKWSCLFFYLLYVVTKNLSQVCLLLVTAAAVAVTADV